MFQSNGKKSASVRKRTRSTSVATRERQREEREAIVLWKRPFTTLHYSLMESVFTVHDWIRK